MEKPPSAGDIEMGTNKPVIGYVNVILTIGAIAMFQRSVVVQAQ